MFNELTTSFLANLYAFLLVCKAIDLKADLYSLDSEVEE